MSEIKNKKIVETKIVDGITYRKCTECDEWLTLDKYYSKCKNNPNWIDSVCKQCRKKKSLKRQKDKHDYILDRNRKKKIEERGIQSPFNYMGNKYLLLPQLLPLFPNKINTCVDLFCGGCNVGLNINANRVICNDINDDIIEFYNQCLYYLQSKEAIKIIKDTIRQYNLDNNEEKYFKQILNDFNQGNKQWNIFYTLVTYSFNQHPLYNKKGDYRTGFGKDICHFNFILEKRLKEFIEHIKNINIRFTNINYKEFCFDFLKENDFVYADPPYLLSSKTYQWNKKDENKLLHILDELNSKNIKFALSNVLEHKNKENTILKEWSKKYNTHYLDRNYSRINRGEIKDTNSQEVLITNY